MKPNLFCKSLLSLAVAAAGFSAQADSLKLSDDTSAYLEAEAINGALSITGNYSGEGDAVDLFSVDVKTNLNNNAKAYSYGTGYVSTLYLGESDLTGTTLSRIGGNVRNNGELYANTVADDWADDWAVALDIAGAEVGGDVINQGSLDASGDFEASALSITGSDYHSSLIHGSVINRGEIGSLAAEAYGIDIRDGSEIAGDVTNRVNGKILVGSYDYGVGINLENSLLQGDLSNDGELTLGSQVGTSYGLNVYDDSLVEGDVYNDVHGEMNVQGYDTAIGINADSSTILGSIGNLGSISATSSAGQASGIDLTRMQASGDIYNGGLISSTGSLAYGIHLAGSTLDGSIINEGTISVTGSRAAAIGLEQLADGYDDEISLPATLASVENHGLLQASGSEVAGVYVGAASFTSDEATAQILNTGTIKADSAGIMIEQFMTQAEDGSLLIQNSGDILSGGYAIYNCNCSAGSVNLDWGSFHAPSTISGNLVGLSNINVIGLARFAGSSQLAEAQIQLNEGGSLNVGDALLSSLGLTSHLSFTQPTTTTINGNLYVAPGSSLGVVIGTETDGPLIDLYGTATFDEGSLIRVATHGSDFRAAGSTYTLLAADSIEDYGLSVVSNSALLQVDGYSVGAAPSGDYDRITATVSTRSAEDIDDALAGEGASWRGRQAMHHFLPVLEYLAEQDESSLLLEYLANLDSRTAAQLVDNLYSTTGNGVRRAGLNGQQLIGKNLGKRIGQLRRGMASGDAFSEHGLWAQTLYSRGDQQAEDGLPGFDTDSRGLAVGIDGKLNDAITLGLAWSYLNSDVSGGSRAEIKGHTLSLYGGYERGNYFADGSLSLGRNDNSGKRSTLGGLARSDYDSQLLGLNLSGGYRMALADGLQFEPRAAARYSRIRSEGYSEKGSSTGLHIGSQSYEVAELGAGIGISKSFATASGSLQPQVSLMGYHDLAADRADTTTRFLLGGTPFVVEGSSGSRNSVEASVGVDYRQGPVTLGVSYEYLDKGGFNADTVQARVRYDF